MTEDHTLYPRREYPDAPARRDTLAAPLVSALAVLLISAFLILAGGWDSPAAAQISPTGDGGGESTAADDGGLEPSSLDDTDDSSGGLGEPSDFSQTSSTTGDKELPEASPGPSAADERAGETTMAEEPLTPPTTTSEDQYAGELAETGGGAGPMGLALGPALVIGLLGLTAVGIFTAASAGFLPRLRPPGR